MPQVIETPDRVWTAADLVQRFGPVPLNRVRHHPAAGSATEKDVIEIHDREGRLYELIDGVLLEKTAGLYESYLAALLARFLVAYAGKRDLGIALGADGMLRLSPGLVRIPDVSFITWDRLPNQTVPNTAIADLAPDLAVEVISPSNTGEEMDGKLDDYFTANVRLVWYVYPVTREVHVFTARDAVTVLREPQTLSGGDVLPGFKLPLRRLFAPPKPKGKRSQ